MQEHRVDLRGMSETLTRPTAFQDFWGKSRKFGDLVCVDHVDTNVEPNNYYTVLTVVDRAINLLGATKLHAENFEHMSQFFNDWNLRPEAMISDSYFTTS